MAKAKPRVVFVADGQEITHRQMEALAALHEKGSMRKAAQHLGLSTPVLHKYIREIEEKSGERLVAATTRGSRLTGEGLRLLARFRAYERRLEDPRALRVAGTVVSERCILAAATELSDAGKECVVTISTDDVNLGLVDEARVDCVVLDDPLHAIERAPGAESVEIGSDMLLLRDAGPRFARPSFGAQRLAFRFLKEKEIPHEVVRVIHEPSILDRTDLSYFVNRSLVRNGLVRAEGAKEQRWSVHSIVGLECSEHEDLPEFLEKARGAWIYRRG